ncbi:hypothetical protein Tco_0326831 [Tanacetum coccineum]
MTNVADLLTKACWMDQYLRIGGGSYLGMVDIVFCGISFILVIACITFLAGCFILAGTMDYAVLPVMLMAYFAWCSFLLKGVCMGRIDSLETELGTTKKIMGGAILTLVLINKLENTPWNPDQLAVPSENCEDAKSTPVIDFYSPHSRARDSCWFHTMRLEFHHLQITAEKVLPFPVKVSTDHIPIDGLVCIHIRSINDLFLISDEDAQIGYLGVAADLTDDEVLLNSLSGLEMEDCPPGNIYIQFIISRTAGRKSTCLPTWKPVLPQLIREDMLLCDDG